MPLFSKKKAKEAQPPPPPQINLDEEMAKLNRMMLTSQQRQLELREKAKKAMAQNNNIMAKQYLAQSKMEE